MPINICTIRMKISKIRFLQGFCIIVLLLGIARCAFPPIAEDKNTLPVDSAAIANDTTTIAEEQDAKTEEAQETSKKSIFFDEQGRQVKHKIWSVSSYAKTFPDTNDIQLTAARQWGIKPVNNRKDAEARMEELVYMESNPYFVVDKLNRSIPYLVPRAALLLQDIGQSFFDSLQIKGVPLHKIIVTSVTRTKEDIARLRRHNSNATENSCHMYGTTFDISYNRYKPVQTKANPRTSVRNDSLKWILSEVLRDKRQQGRCYIKYERKQGCFHITVR